MFAGLEDMGAVMLKNLLQMLYSDNTKFSAILNKFQPQLEDVLILLVRLNCTELFLYLLSELFVPVISPE